MSNRVEVDFILAFLTYTDFDKFESCKTCIVRSACTKSFYGGTLCDKAIKEAKKIYSLKYPTVR